MSVRVLAAILASVFLVAPVRAQQPTDLDKIVPADSLFHVTLDGIGAVKSAAAQAADAIFPGGGAMITQQIDMTLAKPYMKEVDLDKPIHLTVLASGALIAAVPIKNAATFEQLYKSSGDHADVSFIAGQGYSLLVGGGEQVKLEELRAAPAAKPSAVQGTARGFVSVSGLYAKFKDQIESGLAMMSMMSAQSPQQTATLQLLIKSIPTSVPRVDFGLTPSKTSIDLVLGLHPSPAIKGLVSALAHSPSPSATNGFLQTVPQDSVVSFSGTWSDEISTAYLAFADAVNTASGISSEDRAAVNAFYERTLSLMNGDFSGGISQPAGGSGMSMVMVGKLADRDRSRAMLKEFISKRDLVQRVLEAGSTGMSMTMNYKPSAMSIDGVEVDEIHVKAEVKPDAPPQIKSAAPAILQMYAEPVRLAYPTGALVVTMGSGGEARIKQALAALKSGTAPPAAKALPPSTTFASSVNLVGGMKLILGMLPPEMGLPIPLSPAKLTPGSEYVTFGLAPKDGLALMRLTVPTAAIREMQQAIGAAMQSAR